MHALCRVGKELLLVFGMQLATGEVSFSGAMHVLCRVGEELFLYMGCKVGYWRGEVTGLLDDVVALRPTIFSAVPRVFERICSGVNAKLSASFIKSLLYNIGFRWKLAYLKQGVPLHQASSFQLQPVTFPSPAGQFDLFRWPFLPYPIIQGCKILNLGCWAWGLLSL